MRLGDVVFGDIVRFEVGENSGNYVEGPVVETAANGGVVEVRIGGVPFSCSIMLLTHVNGKKQ